MLFATCSSLVGYIGYCVRGGVCPPLRVDYESFSPISRSLCSVLLVLSGCALLRVIYMNYSSWVFKVFCLSNLWNTHRTLIIGFCLRSSSGLLASLIKYALIDLIGRREAARRVTVVALCTVAFSPYYWIHLSFAARTTATDTGHREKVWIHCPTGCCHQPALCVLAEGDLINIVYRSSWPNYKCKSSSRRDKILK